MRGQVPTDVRQAAPHLADAPVAFTALATNLALLDDNPNRLGALIYNIGPGALNVLFGSSAATADNYTFKILAGGLYEVPYGYTGPMRGYYVAAGETRVQELR